MSYYLYYHPSCSKSRKAKEILEYHQCQLTLIDYLKKGLTEDELVQLIQTLDVHPADLIRQKDLDAFDINLSLSSKTQCLDVLMAHPKLLQRPILLFNFKVGIVAREPEKIIMFIQENKP